MEVAAELKLPARARFPPLDRELLALKNCKLPVEAFCSVRVLVPDALIWGFVAVNPIFPDASNFKTLLAAVPAAAPPTVFAFKA